LSWCVVHSSGWEVEMEMEIEPQQALKKLVETEESILAMAVQECKHFEKERRVKKYSVDRLLRIQKAIMEVLLAQEGRHYFVDEHGSYIPVARKSDRYLMMVDRMNYQVNFDFPPKTREDAEGVIDYLCGNLMTMINAYAARMLEVNPDMSLEELTAALRGPSYDLLPPEIKEAIASMLKGAMPALLTLKRTSKIWYTASEFVVNKVVSEYTGNFLCNLPYVVLRFKVFQNTLLMKRWGSPRECDIWEVLGKRNELMAFYPDWSKWKTQYSMAYSDKNYTRSLGAVMAIYGNLMYMSRRPVDGRTKPFTEQEIQEVFSDIRHPEVVADTMVETQKFYNKIKSIEGFEATDRKEMSPMSFGELGFLLDKPEGLQFVARCIEKFAAEYPKARIVMRNIETFHKPELYYKDSPEVVKEVMESEDAGARYGFRWDLFKKRKSTIRINNETVLVQYYYPSVEIKDLKKWIRTHLNDAARNRWFTENLMMKGLPLNHVKEYMFIYHGATGVS